MAGGTQGMTSRRPAASPPPTTAPRSASWKPAGPRGRGHVGGALPPVRRGLPDDQNWMYSRPGSPSGRRRPVFGWRIQRVGSWSMPTWSRTHAATAASTESYHQWSSTRRGCCALRSRRRPRPNRRAMTSHVGPAAGWRRSGRARGGVGQSPPRPFTLTAARRPARGPRSSSRRPRAAAPA